MKCTWPEPLLHCSTLVLCFLGLSWSQASAGVYSYLTLHNLGCRQANHTYAGYLPDIGLSDGDLVQVILAGPNRQVDAPQADGSPGGDDQIAVNPGLPFRVNSESFTFYPNTFYSSEAVLVQDSGFGAEPALRDGVRFYVRVWNGPSPLRATEYFNSSALTRDYPLGYETCPVDSGVRTLIVPPNLPSLVTYAAVLDDGHPVSPASVVLFSPNGGESWAVGDSLDVTWTAEPTLANVDVLLSYDNGASWNRLLSGVENTGSCRVPAEGPASDECLIRLRFTVDTLLYDTSDAPFSLHGDLLPPELLIHADTTAIRLQWQSVVNATSYVVEHSATGSPWYSILSTIDTVCSIPSDSLPSGNRGFYRVRSQQR